VVYFCSDSLQWILGPNFKDFGLSVDGAVTDVEPPLVGWLGAHDGTSGDHVFFAPKDAWQMLAKKSHMFHAKARHSIMGSVLQRCIS
jgi:hypothetical protein